MTNSFKTAATVGNIGQTKPIYTSLISFFIIFVPYFIIWILCWEFNDKHVIDMPTYIVVDGHKSISWQIWTIIFSLFGFYLLLPIILKFTTLNHVNIDCAPFFYSIATFCLIFIITWLIPLDDHKLTTLWIFGRIIIAIITTVIVFFTINKLTNYLLTNSSIGVDLAIDLKKKQEYEDQRHQELKDMKKSSKKEKEFVELEVSTKKKNKKD